MPGVSNVRYSISFRKMVPHTSSDSTTDSFLGSALNSPSPSSSPSPPAESSQSPPAKTPVVLLAGDSFFERLDTTRLSKGKKKVYNIAKGGSKINFVLKAITDFVSNNPTLEVQKLFVCIGVNDIRYCANGIGHLKSSVCDFMKITKQLLPSAKIFFQSLLPIPSNGCPYTERNIIHMNNMLFNLCSRYKTFYIDVFSAFLNCHGGRNDMLFPAFDSIKRYSDIHPNAKGNGVLARFYIYLIHSRWFNPLGY